MEASCGGTLCVGGVVCRGVPVWGCSAMAILGEAALV